MRRVDDAESKELLIWGPIFFLQSYSTHVRVGFQMETSQENHQLSSEIQFPLLGRIIIDSADFTVMATFATTKSSATTTISAYKSQTFTRLDWTPMWLFWQTLLRYNTIGIFSKRRPNVCSPQVATWLSMWSYPPPVDALGINTVSSVYSLKLFTYYLLLLKSNFDSLNQPLGFFLYRTH